MASTHAQDPLWRRLAAFSIDEGRPRLGFARRLARENGWSEEGAQRVLEEYRRFLYLCLRAGHPCTPSVAVDQAWHLHLTYTRSYWDRLCREVLERPLHHGPTAGGREETAKYHDWYARTLASYERLFGEAPPSDLWPPPRRRFAGAEEQRWVDTSRCWVVPKPSWRLLPLAAGVALTGLVTGCLPLAAAAPPGGEGRADALAWISAAATLVLVAIGLAQRHGTDAPVRAQELERDDELLAWLTGGMRRVFEVAVASLLADGRLRATEGEPAAPASAAEQPLRVVRGAEPDEAASELERRLWEQAPSEPEEAVTLDELARRGAPAAQDRRRQFLRLGLVGPDERVSGRRNRSTLSFVLAMIVNLALFLAALAQGREWPAILTATLGLTCAVLAVQSRSLFLRSEVRRRILELRQRAIGPRREAASGAAGSPAELRRRVALLGARELSTDGALAPLALAASSGALAAWGSGLPAPDRREEGGGGCGGCSGPFLAWGGDGGGGGGGDGGDGGGCSGCGGCGGCGG